MLYLISLWRNGKTIQARTSKCFVYAIYAVSACLFDAHANASTEEIQVYTDDLSNPGHFGIDVHNNYVMDGSNDPDYPGGQAPNHVYRLTPEFYYGVTPSVELGFYVLTSHSPDDTTYVDGEKVRLKYIAPHDAAGGGYWGANLEVGRTDLRVSEAPWNAELKFIYGYRWSDWSFAVNSDFDWSIADASQPLSMGLDTKIAYRLSEQYQIGLESYNDLGVVRNPGPLNELSQVIYAALDCEFKEFDLNAGIGRGLTTASDRWVFKFIIGTHF